MLLSVTMRHDIRRDRRRRCSGLPAGAISILLLVAAALGSAHGQTPGENANPDPSATGKPITLDEAIRRAQANEPAYAASSAESRASALDRSIARADLLPDVVYHNQALYTQPNGQQNQAGQGVGSQPSPKFIANNAVREYASQAVINT